MTITRGPVKTAIRVGIYGTEGVGKTTFAAKFPGVVFIDTEGSTKHMDVARFDSPKTYKDVLDCVDYIAKNPADIGTVAIDTIDWLEKFIFSSVCEEKKVSNIEDIGYGKGYIYAKQKLQELLEKLDVLISIGIHVVLVCHSYIRKFELPDEMGSYDRYMLKLNERNIAPLVKEWVDMLLFVNYKTDVITDKDEKTKKGKGGKKRIMYATHSACWDAKNRFGLPDEMPFEYEQIAHLFGEAKPVEASKEETNDSNDATTMSNIVPKPTVTKSKKVPDKEPDTTRPPSMKSENPEKDKLLDTLWGLMVASKLYDSSVIQAVVAEKEYYDLAVPVNEYDTEFIEGCLIGAWDKVKDLALTKAYNLPF